MQTRKRKRGRLKVVLFFLPIVVIGGAVAFAFVSYFISPNTGTLDVTMVASVYGSPAKTMYGTVRVDGASIQSPANLTLRSGAHTVVFLPVVGYDTPAPKSLNLIPGVVSYADGIYYPVKAVIIVTPNSFNATTVKAIRAVTPVVWVNTSSQIVTLQGAAWNTASIDPGGNFTYVYGQSGSYGFDIVGNPNVSGQVNVS
jgi:hypothetical protein